MKKLMCGLVFLGFLSNTEGEAIQHRTGMKTTAKESLTAELDKTSVKVKDLKHKLEKMGKIIRIEK